MVSISSLTWWCSHAIVICGMIPLFPWLTTAPRIAVIAGFAASLWQFRTKEWHIPGWLLNSAIIPPFFMYLVQYRSSNAIQPVVSMLTIMLALRLVSEKNVRHHLQIHALALFCLASSSLFDLSPKFLFFMLVFLLLEAVALVLLTYHDADNAIVLTANELKRLTIAALTLPALSLPLLLLFFPILPRTQIPLWNLRGAPVSQTTGFSETVAPGSKADQNSIREIVFRAETGQLPVSRQYWRVMVFNSFDGRRWHRRNPADEHITLRQENAIEQTIYLEPKGMRYLPTLDAPLSISGLRVQKSSDAIYEQPRRSGKKLAYKVSSDNSGFIATASIKPVFYLQTPEQLPLRMIQLADTIRRSGSTAEQKIAALDRYFMDNRFRYSTQGMPTGDRALETFLFESRQGNCEFFASSYALLLRKAGISARLVGGYLGGEFNQLGGYYLVSEEMAHVWVEAHIGGKWQRIDPSSFAGNAGELWGKKPDVTPLQRIRLAADALDYYWNRTVITYDFEQQVEVARSIGSRLKQFEFKHQKNRSRKSALLLLSGVCIWLLWYKRSTLFASRESRLLQRFHHRLETDCGMTVIAGSEGVFELAARSGSRQAEEFARIYGGAVYHGRRINDAEYRQLKAICEKPFMTRSS